jgi:hypothetical protein
MKKMADLRKTSFPSGDPFEYGKDPTTTDLEDQYYIR